MNILEAFMERNDLKAEIKELKSKIQSKLITEKDLEEKVDLTPVIERFVLTQQALTKLNIAIHTANVAVMPTLKKIEELTETLSVLQDVKTVIETTPLRERNMYKRVDTDPTFIEKECSIPIDYITVLVDALKAEKRTLEKRVSKLNASCEVSYK